MPSIKKKALSLYLRTGCLRQLALTLRSDPELRENGMPERQKARAGLGLVGQAGYEWQDEKVSELDSVFGKDNVYVNPKRDGNRPGSIELADFLPRLSPNQFLVEARYDAETQTFMTANKIDQLQDSGGNPVKVGSAYPDLIQVLPSMHDRPSWEVDDTKPGPPPTALAVLPDGEVFLLSNSDDRLRLRVIDIKQAAEPGAHYFAEVVYYSITLASWITEHGLNNEFVVVAAPAVWPGSYEGSAITLVRELCRKEGREPRLEELLLALEDDIEIAPFDAFAPRLRRFFQEELPYVLNTPWDELPWHVSYNCKGCEFLGYPWLDQKGNLTNHEKHCWPTAERISHLSQVAGLSRGSAKLLAASVPDVTSLASLPTTDDAFDSSPTLRSKRTLYPYRARSLKENDTRIVPDSGSDALMPRWPDLHIYIFLDYDLSSAITAAFSVRAFWKEPLPWGSTNKAKQERWSSTLVDGRQTNFQEVFLVDLRKPEREREELLKFLRTLRKIMDHVQKQDNDDVNAGRRGDVNEPKKVTRSSYQIYLWDEAQRKHLVRVIGRHLGAILADKNLRDIAWLFPPPELLTFAEEASYKSPFTIVSSVVQNTVAVPVPHHYTLLEVVETYRLRDFQPPSVHPLYQEPLSDLIPGERLHEMWTRRGNWLRTTQLVEETTKKKLSALTLVVAQLEKDLKDVLSRSSAPQLVRSSSRLTSVPPHSELWYEYSRLNAALAELDDHTTRSMPPHEREARFKSAHLLQRLEGDEKRSAYTLLAKSNQHPLPSVEEVMIYTLDVQSREFNVRPPALGFALAPRSQPGFLMQAAYPLVKNADIKATSRLTGNVAEAGLTKVSVVAIDRIHRLVALKRWYTNCALELEQKGLVDFRTSVMLDPVGEDFLTKKVKLTLAGIGWPESAFHDTTTLQALGITVTDRPTYTSESPASEFLWQAPMLALAKRDAEISLARSELEKVGVQLNTSQWVAWERSLSQRLTLIWGPPGTGKSQTLRAVVAGAVWTAINENRPLRLLISSGTYTAVDNVLLGVDELLKKLLPSKSYQLFRLQSQYNVPPVEMAMHPDITPIIVQTTQPPSEVLKLQASLENPTGVVIVASPSQQLHNLSIATKNKTKNEKPEHTQRSWFDIVIIDEASQLDVAESTLIVSKAAKGAAFVLAGDDKQLPPIHQATPPLDLDHVVGSVYSYIRYHHKVEPTPLQTNYRSCQTLVDFTKRAGYDPGLHAHNTQLRLKLLNENLSTEKPEGWPDSLYWTSEWTYFIEPTKSALCFIYEDEVAGQSNDFEADAVASLLWLFYGRFDSQLAGELDRSGRLKQPTNKPCGETEFWQRAVGVVTPHRAQMGKIVTRLQEVFPDHDPTRIWNAVDTVERFQGQQRDVIVASFGLGDPDLIRTEDEFLYSLNRFNVMASRARAKLIVFTTRSLIDHLSNDAEVLEESRLLKNYAESFCQNPISITLGYRKDLHTTLKPGFLRVR